MRAALRSRTSRWATCQSMVDDIECKVLKMEPVSKPMKLTLMIDNGPANSTALANLRTAVRNFIEAIPADVSMEILTIAPQPRWLEKMTTDHEKLLKAVDRLSPDTGPGSSSTRSSKRATGSTRKRRKTRTTACRCS